MILYRFFFFFSSRRRHTRSLRDWSSDVCSSDLAAIGVPHELKGEAIVVFVVLRTGHTGSAALAREISETIVERLGRPLRPASVQFVTDLPKTRNAKILRRVIRNAYLGHSDLGDHSALENPAAVAQNKLAAHPT